MEEHKLSTSLPAPLDPKLTLIENLSTSLWSQEIGPRLRSDWPIELSSCLLFCPSAITARSQFTFLSGHRRVTSRTYHCATVPTRPCVTVFIPCADASDCLLPF
jgi:hypothetical protein